MTTTPQRRSARVSRMPDRLEGGNTTPQKRSKAVASKGTSAFSSPKGGNNKRQKTLREKTASRSRKQTRGEESEAESDEDREIATSESAVSDSEEGDDVEAPESRAENSSEEEAASSDFEEPRSGRTRSQAPRRTPQKRGARVKQTQRVVSAESIEPHNAGESVLLEALTDETVAVAQVSKDWIAEYREDADTALCELINFVIGLAGSPGRISVESLYETDNAAAEVETQQQQTLTVLRRNGRDGADGGSGEVLLGRTKEQRRIRRNVLQFVQRVVVDGQHHVVFGEQADEGQLSAFMEAALPWLAALAGSSFRPFRHVATLVALAIQSALISIRARAAGEQQTAQRQVDAEQRRRRRGEATRAAQLQERVAEVARHDVVAAAAFDALYNAVFVYRCRDVHAGIRAECLTPLATWCRAFPAAYMHTQYLRYLGWALNDKDARVREASVAAVAGPLLLGRPPAAPPGAVGSGVGALASAEASAVEGIRPFVVRFLPRLVQMAAGDVDSRVQVAALKLMTQLAVHGYLDGSADIGDIRRAAPRHENTKSHGRASNRRLRSTYSGSLSQQMLEESSGDESEAEEASEPLGIHVLSDDGGGPDAAVLGCPRHSTMRVLAPLVAHTHASVRAAAAELVAWWLRSEWVSAARVAALGVDRVLDGDALRVDEDSGDKDADDAEAAAPDADVDELLSHAAGRIQAHKWLVFRALGAFLWHVDRAGGSSGSSSGSSPESTDEPEREWVEQQVAACIEELWAAPAAAVGFVVGDDQHAALARAKVGSLTATALDRRIDAAVATDQSAAPPRLVAAAQALWSHFPELANPASLAEFLAWDHSAPAAQRTALACFAVTPTEETALLHAFAVSVAERRRVAAERARRSRSRKDRADLTLERDATDRLWQGAFVSLLVRCSDSPTRLLPLMFLAAEQLDLQALFDADRVDVIADVAKHAAMVLERYGANVRLVRLAAAFLDRVDSSRILRTAALPDAEQAATAPGELVSRAAVEASAQLVAAVAAVPDASHDNDSAYADVSAHSSALRALLRLRDVSPQLAGSALSESSTEENPSAAAVEQLFLLVELAARSLVATTVPENAVLPALDGIYHFLLWRALAFDHQLQTSAASHEEEASFWQRAEAEAARLRTARDRLMALCGTLLDSAATTYACLREHAFAVLGRVQRLFSGPLTRSSPDRPRERELRRSMAVGFDNPAQAQLVEFFEKRLAGWAYLVARLPVISGDSTVSEGSGVDDEDEQGVPASLLGTLEYYRASPSSWSIGYSRFCALAALWAQWIGDQTIPIACLPSLAAYTGMLGLESIERRRVEVLAGGNLEKAAPKRKVGFVALSAFDHIVQSAVDALRPMVVLQSTRERAMEAYVAAMRASFDKHLDSSEGTKLLPPTDPVNVATLARFVGTALRSAFSQTSSAQPLVTPSRTGAQFTLAPAVVGAAWTKCHLQAIDFGLARVVPNALLAASNDTLSEDEMTDAAGREPVEDSEWDRRVGPWFVALAQTVSGVIRPRHAETLNEHLKHCANKLGFGEVNSSFPDADAARAAIAPYQRALDKELAKLGAIKARMAESRVTDPRNISAQLLSSPPVSPTPATRTQTMLNFHDSDPQELMEVD
ncbi:cohesin complex subunit [Coemansia sp. RSA 988]|nr:cohesin complex subunit [Coemansia sp. RSA 988]